MVDADETSLSVMLNIYLEIEYIEMNKILSKILKKLKLKRIKDSYFL